MTEQQIEHQADPKKYFTMIPNLIDDSDLNPFEFRLLVHYYRVGNCWEGTKATAKKCNMAMGTVSKHRRSLAKKGWITLKEPAPEDYTSTIKITVIDKWSENFQSFTPSYDSTPPSLDESPPSFNEDPPSLDETKNTNTKKIKAKNTVPPLSDFIHEWKRLFPNKPQPRSGNKKLKKQWQTRFKDDGFKDDWLTALSVAARSATCQSESWFNANYFLRSEETWTNCLSDWMAWKDNKKVGNTSQFRKSQDLPQVVGEF